MSRDHRALTALAALPAAHRRFADRGTGAIYLVDYPVAADARAAELLGEIVNDGRSEIGAQLHPWVTPPFDEAMVPANSYPGNLPRALEAAKLDQLTNAIAAAFGRPPRIYRAGRYGIGPNTRALLAERGYRVDSSIRARYDYRAEGGPDFRAIGSRAFRGELLSIPLTTVFTGRARSGAAWLYDLLGRVPKGRGVAARLGVMRRIALTPEEMPLVDALEAIRVALGEGSRLLTFSFHSPSLAPGHTPYVRDEADLRRFWAWWDEVFDLLERRDVCATTLDEVLGAAR